MITTKVLSFLVQTGGISGPPIHEQKSFTIIHYCNILLIQVHEPVNTYQGEQRAALDFNTSFIYNVFEGEITTACHETQ